MQDLVCTSRTCIVKCSIIKKMSIKLLRSVLAIVDNVGYVWFEGPTSVSSSLPHSSGTC